MRSVCGLPARTSWTVAVFIAPARAYRSAASSIVRSGLPSTAVTMSPLVSPAFANSEPACTFSTASPFDVNVPSIADASAVKLLSATLTSRFDSLVTPSPAAVAGGIFASALMVIGAAGVAVGAVSSLLGVAGGELIIPILIFLFGADIKTAGTASVIISIPIVVAGIARHILTGHFRSRSMLGFLVLPMSIGSIFGALIGGYAAAWVPSETLRVVLAVILLGSALKLWRKADEH